MSPDLLMMYCGAIGALIAAYKTFKSETRLVPALITSVLVVVTLVSGVEANVRKTTEEEISARLEQEWIASQDEVIEFVQVELLMPDGQFSIREARSKMEKVRLQVSGNDFVSAIGGQSETVSIASLFSDANLKSAGRIGQAHSVVKIDKAKNVIEKFDSVTCVSSSYTTHLAMERIAQPNLDQEACSINVTIPLAQRSMRVRDLAKAAKIGIYIDGTEPLRCLGICKVNLLSIRLVLPRLSQGLPARMIELSPQIYLQDRRSISEGREFVFETTGSTWLDLAKSYYRQSRGFVDREYFGITTGLLHALYVKLTAHEGTGKFIDTVWTTHRAPDEKLLIEAIPPGQRAGTQFYGLPEWCGFGRNPTCWYRYIAFNTSLSAK